MSFTNFYGLPLSQGMIDLYFYVFYNNYVFLTQLQQLRGVKCQGLGLKKALDIVLMFERGHFSHRNCCNYIKNKQFLTQI